MFFRFELSFLQLEFTRLKPTNNVINVIVDFIVFVCFIISLSILQINAQKISINYTISNFYFRR